MIEKYGITFPIMEKAQVVGMEASPLFTWLSTQANREITTNFSKYLLDSNGKMKKYYAAKIDPKNLIPDLAGLLD